MPRDKNGQPIRPGDIVTVRCRVTGVDKDVDFKNVALETIEPTYPGDFPARLLLNAKQVVVVESIGASNPDLDVMRAISDSQDEIDISRHTK